VPHLKFKSLPPLAGIRTLASAASPSSRFRTSGQSIAVDAFEEEDE